MGLHIKEERLGGPQEDGWELCRPSTTPTSAKAALVGDPGKGLESIFHFTQHSQGTASQAAEKQFSGRAAKRTVTAWSGSGEV
jgi:hypothetical protein